MQAGFGLEVPRAGLVAIEFTLPAAAASAGYVAR